MSALDKVLKLAGPQEPEADPAGMMVLAARLALTEVHAYLADSQDDDPDDDGDGEGGGHSSHGTYKALVKKNVDPKRAAAMCAKADKRVKATRLAESALVALSSLDAPEHAGAVASAREFGLTAASRTAAGDEKLAAAALLGLSVLTTEERKKPSAHTIPGSDDYPIPDKAHLSAAVARYKQGKLAGHSAQEVAAHIRSRGKALGETVDLTPGSGLDEAAELVAMAAKAMGDGGVIMNHGPFTGSHAHSHFQSGVHAHPHQHFGDNAHEGGPQHRPGSKPGGRAGW